MTKSYAYSLVLLTVIFISGSVFADTTSGTSKPFTIASYAFAPHIIEDSKTGPSGAFIDRVRDAANRADINVEFMIVSWPRAQRLVKSGQVDAIWPVVKTKERSEWLYYPEHPLNTFEFAIFTHAERGIKFDGELEQLRGLTFGKLRAGKFHPRFSEAVQKRIIEVEERDTIYQLIKGIELGRLDGFVFPRSMGHWQVKQSGVESVVSLKTPIGLNPAYLALSKMSTRLEEWRRLNKHLLDTNVYPSKLP